VPLEYRTWRGRQPFRVVCHAIDEEYGAEIGLALTHGLDACGDEHAIYTFTSRRRAAVTVSTVKGFE
jgi:hypothetical protein